MDRHFQRRLLFDMLRIRTVEETIADLYCEQEMRCPVHLCIGQEAVAVGVCAALQPGDYAMSGHRSHGHYLAKGGNLRAMMAEIYGRITGCARGKGGSMHLVDLSAGFLGAAPIVGSTIPIATGVALGVAMRGESRVTVAFFGEGATEEGVFHEALNFAVLRRLPVLFVCENNLYSVYSPLSVRQPDSRTVCDVAAGHGLPCVQADGNDVVAVYERTVQAAAHARKGGGPTFLEFQTYRWREHCGPNYDNDIGYRSEREFERWKARCPIRRLEECLIAAGDVRAEELAARREALRAEVADAVSYAKTSPFPENFELHAGLYAP